MKTGSRIPKPGDNNRSTEWLKVRKAWLKDHSTCAGCGGKMLLQVHHMKPFHLYPDLELVVSNFITLCERPTRDCHYRLGHEFDWKAYNEHVVEDADTSLKRVASRVYK